MVDLSPMIAITQGKGFILFIEVGFPVQVVITMLRPLTGPLTRWALRTEEVPDLEMTPGSH